MLFMPGMGSMRWQGRLRRLARSHAAALTTFRIKRLSVTYLICRTSFPFRAKHDGLNRSHDYCRASRSLYFPHFSPHTPRLLMPQFFEMLLPSCRGFDYFAICVRGQHNSTRFTGALEPRRLLASSITFPVRFWLVSSSLEATE